MTIRIYIQSTSDSIVFKENIYVNIHSLTYLVIPSSNVDFVYTVRYYVQWLIEVNLLYVGLDYRIIYQLVTYNYNIKICENYKIVSQSNICNV